jgi:cell division protein FtsL
VPFFSDSVTVLKKVAERTSRKRMVCEMEFRTYSYYDGNAALENEEVLPDREALRQERRRQEALRRRKEARRQARQLRAMKMQAVLFTGVIILIGALFTGYVHLQNSITRSRNNISSLQEEVTTLKADNAAAKNRIATSLNLNAIKDTAVNQLGMVYADTDQIVYYNMESEDYMNQYEEMP